MSTETLQPSSKPSSSLRDRVKDRLSISGTSFRRPKFLTNEPASPARYKGKPISSGYDKSARDGGKEQWYFPPETPSLKPQRTVRRSVRSRDSALAGSGHSSQRLSTDLIQRAPTPRASSSAYHLLSEVSLEQLSRRLVLRDFRNEKRIMDSDVEIRSGMLYDLIHTIPSVWLCTPKIKEAFIPLLRSDGTTTREKSPTPTELRLIDGFLQHLPDIHIVPTRRIPRKRPSTLEYKRNLNLSSEVLPLSLVVAKQVSWSRSLRNKIHGPMYCTRISSSLQSCTKFPYGSFNNFYTPGQMSFVRRRSPSTRFSEAC